KIDLALLRAFLENLLASAKRDLLRSFFFFSSRRRHTRWPRDWSSACALPILDWNRFSGCPQQRLQLLNSLLHTTKRLQNLFQQMFEDQFHHWKRGGGRLESPRCFQRFRSEERRVGKECRARLGGYRINIEMRG